MPAEFARCGPTCLSSSDLSVNSASETTTPGGSGGASEGRPAGAYSGLRVVAFESRRAGETARLIESAGGIPIVAPSMRELPIEENPDALRFGERLVAGAYDAVVFMTGVGAKYLFESLEGRHSKAELVNALSATGVVARGPKPVRVLKDLGVPIRVTVPEPNTWREMLAAMDSSFAAEELKGASVAVQEYGIPNDRFLAELTRRGAEVDAVAAYRWALPEDIRPVGAAIRQILDRTADVVLFTSATQVRHVLEIARRGDLEDELRAALAETVICSIGPVCTETLVALGLAPDFEPSRSKLGALVGESAAVAIDIVSKKRAAVRPPARARRDATGESADAWKDGAFMRACRREPVPHTPVWLMRQAGRYMQEYREVRARVPFIELCKTPDLAAEVCVTAAERIGADAAILFSDILLIVEPMGLGLAYTAGGGPSISRNVRGPEDVERIEEVDVHESLAFVFEAVRRTRAELDPKTPLIGFSGAPFTLASYMIEGGGSKNYIATKRLMYGDRGAWDEMMGRISRAVAAYLNAQIEAGCQAVQLFDSWVGCLSPTDYETYVLPHTRAVFDELPAGVPSIHFGTETATLLELQARCGSSVLGVDHRVRIGSAFERFPDLTIQGNLDPVALFAGKEHIRAQAAAILGEVAGRNGHIFNLGHGILPGTPVDNVIALVDAVHEFSSRS
jgi:uroporphyrinogen decarboxylase